MLIFMFAAPLIYKSEPNYREATLWECCSLKGLFIFYQVYK